MKKSAINLFLLPGFMGQPNDWQGIIKEANSIHIITTDLYEEGLPHPEEGLWAWADGFNRTVSKQHGSSKNIILGYSLGGRLAMHAFLKQPSLWQGAIFISAHTGIQNDKERSMRKLLDDDWAKRFLEDPWNDLMTAWNAQSVFKNDKHTFTRTAEDYDRTLLADTLRHWSLANQNSLISLLEKIELPQLWVAGQDDHRFSAMAQQMQFVHPLSKTWIAPNTGHRVPWQSLDFANHVNTFIKEIFI